MPPRIAIYVFGMNETQLRKPLGEPTELVRQKIADRRNPFPRS
jgi:hypothetical protein